MVDPLEGANLGSWAPKCRLSKLCFLHKKVFTDPKSLFPASHNGPRKKYPCRGI
jgi:hypothetical protein